MARRLRASKNGAAKPEGTTALEAAKAPSKRDDQALARAKATRNVTDDAIVAAVMECGGLKADLESAQGAYRAALKKWEERGVDAADVTWFLKLKKREIPDVEAEIRRRNRLLRAMQHPIGAQLGLFGDGESVAKKVDDDKIAAQTSKAGFVESDELDRAKAAGRDAGLRDYGPDVNPHPDGSPRALAWEGGRKAGLDERARTGAEVTAPRDDRPAEVIAGETIVDMRALRSDGAAAAS